MKVTEETKMRAQAIYDHLVAHPELHDQAFYGKQTECGTTLCIAGYALVAFEPESVEWTGFGAKQFMKTIIEERSIDSVAGDLLGLESYAEREYLFHEMNNGVALEKLRGIAEGRDFKVMDEDDDACDCELCV